MFITDLDHLEICDEKSNLSGGAADTLGIELTGDGGLIISLGEQKLFETKLSSPPQEFTLSLKGFPGLRIRGKSQSPDGLNTSLFAATLPGLGDSTLSFLFG